LWIFFGSNLDQRHIDHRMATIYDPDDGGNDVHMSSYVWRSPQWAATRVHRSSILRLRAVYPVTAYVLAAVEVQRFWRGVLLRRRVLQKYLHGRFVRRWRTDEAVVGRVYAAMPKASETAFEALISAAQARWRTVLLRAEFGRWSAYDTWPIYYVAAATMQRAWVDYKFRRDKRHHRHRSKRFFLSREHAMAGKIQLLWRAFVSRQIFAFYKQLIRFREGGDPQLMLKAINPSEAYLMDVASGQHVRFRLGGAAYPPTIFYKIFTHRCVADIGAFAPKDYTAARKQRSPAATHNHDATVANGRASSRTAGGAQPVAGRRDGWYQRFENNAWRPVAEAVFTGSPATPGGATLPPLDAGLTQHEQRIARFLSRDAVPAVAPAPRVFHATRARRRVQQGHHDRKLRRRWLVELYAAEQVEQRAREPSTAVRRDAQRLFDTMTDEEVDAETAKLVTWSTSLDFDAYRGDWQRLATTAPTDSAKPN
jgi:hypothetical protein